MLLDLDGVLVDSWSVACQAFEISYKDAGLGGHPPFDSFEDRLGLPLHLILEELALPNSMNEIFNRAALKLSAMVRPFPGIPEMLSALVNNGYVIGIVTGKARIRALDILVRTGLLSFIDALVTPDDAPGKPDPAALRYCLQQLGNISEVAFFLGDTAVDMQAAKNAGLKRALAAWGGRKELPKELYDLRFGHPDELVRFLTLKC